MARESREQVHGLYVYTPMLPTISINNLISFHYYEYAPHYSGVVESHDFWEMVYANSGTIQCCAGPVTLELRQGQAVFHPPMEQHQLVAIGRDSSICILSFTCENLDPELFRGRIMNLDREQRELVASIFSEGQRLFEPPYNQLFQPKLELTTDAPYGAMQMVRNQLEILMILILRTQWQQEGEASPPVSGPKRVSNFSREMVVNSIMAILQANMGRNLLVKDIAQAMNFSPSYLQTLFREEMQMSIMSYFRKMKMDEAKKLISSGEHSFTEISEMLGFSSIHHFSSAFHKAMKMTPTEYRNSVEVTGLR